MLLPPFPVSWQNSGMGGKKSANDRESGDQAGNRNAEEWLTQYGDYLYRYALFRLSNEEIARDMVQETLIAAWKAHEKFRGDSSVRTWLVGIMKHKITDYVRKQIRDRNLASHLETDPTSDFFDANGQWLHPVQGWNDDPERLSSNQEFLQALSTCVAKLPEQHRHVFSLRELSGEDIGSICKACDITPTNLHVIMHRARLALRKCLEKTWFGDK